MPHIIIIIITTTGSTTINVGRIEPVTEKEQPFLRKLRNFLRNLRSFRKFKQFILCCGMTEKYVLKCRSLKDKSCVEFFR